MEPQVFHTQDAEGCLHAYTVKNYGQAHKKVPLMKKRFFIVGKSAFSVRQFLKLENIILTAEE